MKKLLYLIGGLILLYFAWMLLHAGNNIFTAQKNTEKTAPMSPAINGVMINSQIANSRPIAVVVENHPDSRPQSGLVDADLVYETLAEGGITRFLAVYQTADAKNIGPIRSARTYFARIANELGAVFAHVGGNNDVLADIKANRYPKLAEANQFYSGQFFHRIKERQAPHNVYTSIEKLKALETFHHYSTQAGFAPWQFADKKPGDSNLSNAYKITLPFSFKTFEASYIYDPMNDTYKRFLAGAAHQDKDAGQQISAKNIIVQMVNITPIPHDPEFAVNINLTSGGKALVFKSGKVIIGTWRISEGRTRYYDSQNTQIAFNRGQTWIELFPESQADEIIYSANAQ